MSACGKQKYKRRLRKAFCHLTAELVFPPPWQKLQASIGRLSKKILTAAKDPQLESKLQNMPVPLTADLVDPYIRPVLEAAWSGDLAKITIRE